MHRVGELHIVEEACKLVIWVLFSAFLDFWTLWFITLIVFNKFNFYFIRAGYLQAFGRDVNLAYLLCLIVL